MTKKYIPSLKDIAEVSGVSVSTVSRVIHKKAVISPETTERVMAAAKKLGYHSNKLIEGMQTGKTQTIGVVIPIDDYYFNRIVQGIHNALLPKGYLPISMWTRGDLIKEQELLHRLVEHRVEGIIICPLRDWATDSYFSEVIERGLPVVCVDRKIPANIDFIGADDFNGGWQAADQLIKLGHQHLGYFQGPQFASTASLRKEGFLARVTESDTSSCTVFGDPDYGAPREDLINEFLVNNKQVSAISAFNDKYALELYDVALKRGLKLPDDLSILGFGDLPIGWGMRPQLATFDQSPIEIGIRAVKMLFDRMANWTSEIKETRLKPTLLAHDSICKKSII